VEPTGLLPLSGCFCGVDWCSRFGGFVRSLLGRSVHPSVWSFLSLISTAMHYGSASVTKRLKWEVCWADDRLQGMWVPCGVNRGLVEDDPRLSLTSLACWGRVDKKAASTDAQAFLLDLFVGQG